MSLIDSIIIECERPLWPVLLKKSAMVFAAEEYASEIEIFTFGKGLQAQISRSLCK
jgi:hypothetical protein